MSVIKILKKLISIPSYLNSNTNEKKISDFVYSYLKSFPYLRVKKQKVSKNRFNIIAETSGTPNLFLAGHLDTVEPKQGWSRDQLNGVIEKNKLYGIGSLDTKSGVAAILDSLNDFNNISNLNLFFYCDEEYDFKGTKKFISNYRKKIGNFAVFTEPTDLRIWSAHRGIIEIYFSVLGESGHAANLKSGKNAIDGIYNLLNNLKKWMENFSDPVLGSPTLNIAYLRGGLYQEKKKNLIKLGKQGNNIADFAETVIDIRPTDKKLNAKKIISQIKKYLKTNQYKFFNYSIRHDFGSLNTDTRKITRIEKIIKNNLGKAEYLNPSNKGYGDGQLIAEKFGIPVIYLGPKGKNAHGVDEWVDINSVKKLRKIFSDIIKNYCKTKK